MNVVWKAELSNTNDLDKLIDYVIDLHSSFWESQLWLHITVSSLKQSRDFLLLQGDKCVVRHTVGIHVENQLTKPPKYNEWPFTAFIAGVMAYFEYQLGTFSPLID